MMLQTEVTYFNSIKDELLKNHEGKFALVIGQELVGTFDRHEDAYRKGIEKYGNVPMLIKRVSSGESVGIAPALAFGLLIRGNN